MNLSDLVGPHVLSGVDTDPRESEYRMADSIAFTLDGIPYVAVESDDDGYRSSMESITVDKRPTQNTFPGVKVLARMVDNDEILEILSVETGKLILRVGTDNADDYYPSWVAEYLPAHL